MGPVKHEAILRVGGTLEGLLVDQREEMGIHQVAAHEAEVVDGSLIVAVGGEQKAAGLGHPQGFGQGLVLFLVSEQVVHGPQQQRDIIGFILESGQVDGVALPDGDVLAGLGILLEDVDVALKQLQRVHLITHPCQCVAVAACGSADFQNAHAGLQVLFQIAHGGQKLDLTAAALQSSILIVGFVVHVQVIFDLHGFSSFQIKKQCRRCQNKQACTASASVGTEGLP